MVTAPISKTEKSLFLITLHSNAIKITNRDRKSKYSQMLFQHSPVSRNAFDTRKNINDFRCKFGFLTLLVGLFQNADSHSMSQA
ncbi:hypothetical protein HMPREF1218_0799 [Hoylesella pleuritidis F0068]|uniref:Uncharacterized protein n=1 Tax=Hoylesella pleuritidis F0068 TaxID=1081904 RepID=U2L0D9_9BACT|nr:hypothetical protein HMPREF1218_0799 [Hoylesella pleuritidis F0068]